MAFKHRNHYHDRASEARQCEQGMLAFQAAEPSPIPSDERVRPWGEDASRNAKAHVTPEFVTDPATPKQVGYIKRLAAERDPANLDPNVIETLMDVDDDKQISFREARTALDALEAAPRKAGAKATGATGAGGYPVFEDGYYALRDEDGVVKFYSLHHEDNGGKYDGWPVLTAQASDEHHLMKNRQSKIDVINRINEDPKAARLLYADELGQCYVCGRTLTDETSRRLGIGPVCRGKHPTLVYEREAA